MRIGIDITTQTDQFANRGIGNYTYEVVRELIKSYPDNEWILFGFNSFKENLNILGLRKENNIKFVSLGKVRLSGPGNIFLFETTFKSKIIAAKLDVFFAPHFERGLPIGKVKTVVTMHDIIPFVTNKYSGKGNLFNWLKGIYYRRAMGFAKQADVILSDSDFTTRELVFKGGFPENKIKRVYLGIKDSFREANIPQDTRDVRRVLMIYKVSKPYILYYGGLEPNKNVNTLLYAFKNVIKRFPEMKLVIVGKDFKLGWDNKVQPLNKRAAEVIQLCDELHIKHNVIYTGAVDDPHIPIVMKNAELFCHLSTYEGFGFSPLEALAAGIPVVAARKSCYPEILQDAVEFVNPSEAEKVSSAILNLLEDQTNKDSKISKGLKLASKYTWKETAKNTFTAINNLYNNIPELNYTFLLPLANSQNSKYYSYAYETAKVLVNKGHKVTFITFKTSPKEEKATELDGIQIKRFENITGKYLFAFSFEMLLAILNSKIDVLQTFGSGFWLTDLSVFLKNIVSPKTILINFPIYNFFDDSGLIFLKKLIRKIIIIKEKLFINKLYSTVLQINNKQEQWLKKLAFKVTKIRTFGLFFNNTQQTVNEALLAEYKLSKKLLLLAKVSSNRDSGIDHLLTVIQKLVLVHKSVKLLLAVDSKHELESINTKLAEAKIEKLVTVILVSTDADLKTLLSCSKIYINAKRYDEFGELILNSFATGIPVVSSRNSAGEFLIKEEKNGYIFDFGDEAELYNYLNKLIADKVLYKEIASNNSIKSKQFEIGKITEDYLKIITELLKP